MSSWLFGLVLGVTDEAVGVICGWWLCVCSVSQHVNAVWGKVVQLWPRELAGVSEHAPTRPVGMHPHLNSLPSGSEQSWPPTPCPTDKNFPWTWMLSGSSCVWLDNRWKNGAVKRSIEMAVPSFNNLVNIYLVLLVAMLHSLSWVEDHCRCFDGQLTAPSATAHRVDKGSRSAVHSESLLPSNLSSIDINQICSD